MAIFDARLHGVQIDPQNWHAGINLRDCQQVFPLGAATPLHGNVRNVTGFGGRVKETITQIIRRGRVNSAVKIPTRANTRIPVKLAIPSRQFGKSLATSLVTGAISIKDAARIRRALGLRFVIADFTLGMRHPPQSKSPNCHMTAACFGHFRHQRQGRHARLGVDFKQCQCRPVRVEAEIGPCHATAPSTRWAISVTA